MIRVDLHERTEREFNVGGVRMEYVKSNKALNMITKRKEGKHQKLSNITPQGCVCVIYPPMH